MQSDQYTAQVKVMPEIQSKTGGLSGNLSSLAGLAGINVDGLSGGTEGIRPDLYPTVLQSIPFGLYMMRQPIKVAEVKKPFTLIEYMPWATEKSLAGSINRFLFGWLSSDPESEKNKQETITGPVLNLSSSEQGAVDNVLSRVSGDIDKKSGILTISARMPHPDVAAEVAQYALDYLTIYVTNYRTGRARKQVGFLEQQVRHAQRRYQTAEYVLSSYRDQNRSVYLNTAKLDEQRLQADFLLTQGLFNDLTKQLEQAKIKVQEEVPVFQTLEPARVPLIKSGPKRTVIVLAAAIFGAMAGFLAFFAKWAIREKIFA
jgi:uncharacterized protein involved in exopolysaccharide biosynthesis